MRVMCFRLLTPAFGVRIVCVATAAILFTCFGAAQQPAHEVNGVQTLAIGPGTSEKIELRVAKTGLYRGKTHVFLFPAYSGTLRYDPLHPETSQIRLRIDAGSIHLTDTWLGEKDFKEVQRYAIEEMLDAKQYPEITFVSSQVQSKTAGHFVVQGTLTIRGVAKPAIVNVALQTSGGALTLTGDAIVRLRDFGLKPPTAGLGMIGTKDEMTLSFALDAR